MPESTWKIISRTFCFLLIPIILFAEVSGPSHSMMQKMELLVLQLGVIIFVAKGMSILFEKIKIPGVVGELTAG
ncbi:TPA: hypothetical protein DCG86_03430, partial [Candidatus Marinimicrobia bacterium]|nr:hypothetical protein [Candidatus Neomarinimicrobiota bacterium]